LRGSVAGEVLVSLSATSGAHTSLVWLTIAYSLTLATHGSSQRGLGMRIVEPS
jgi:hypothetical protein